jgi:hypothetical protein
MLKRNRARVGVVSRLRGAASRRSTGPVVEGDSQGPPAGDPPFLGFSFSPFWLHASCFAVRPSYRAARDLRKFKGPLIGALHSYRYVRSLFWLYDSSGFAICLRVPLLRGSPVNPGLIGFHHFNSQNYKWRVSDPMFKYTDMS